MWNDRESNLRLAVLAFALSVGLQMPAANAQSAGATSGTGAPARAAAAAGEVGAKQTEQYYIDFRARYAISYGHTFVVFGRGSGPGKKINPNQIAGLTPATDNPIPYYIGHLLPVPAETGASEGDDDAKYMSAHYLVRLNKAEYDRVIAYIKQLKAEHRTWHAVVYNCNDFVADIARFVGLKVPSTMLFAKYFIEGIRDLNTGTRHAAVGGAASAVH